MARPSTSYEPRRPADAVLYQIVQDHLGTFVAQTGRLRDGDGVPQFVERAFRDFLRCGFLAACRSRRSAWRTLAAYTRAGAYASFEEGAKGTIAPGMLADLTLLDRDLRAIPAAAIRDARVVRTVVGGQTVFAK